MLQYAHAVGFTKSCRDEIGGLLQLLVAQAAPGVIAEIGTGGGVGAAWMMAGLREDQRFVSIEQERTLHGAVIQRQQDARAQFLLGDWRAILEHAPFSFVFVDVSEAKDEGRDTVIDATRPGGLIVLDDFTPSEVWPPTFGGQPDLRKIGWLEHPGLLSRELLVTATSSLILAVRIPS